METFLEIIKYILPSLVVFAASYLVIKRFLDNEYRKQLLLLRQENQKTTTPLRIQAYERLLLFLERISMDKLVLRVHRPGISAKLLQADLLKTIQDEYEHNLTQQLYISNNAWETVKKVKEESVKIINMAGTQMEETAKGTDLGKKIFEIMMQLENSPTQVAISVIKKEVRVIF